MLEAVPDLDGDGLDWYVHCPFLHDDCMSPFTCRIFRPESGINHF